MDSSFRIEAKARVFIRQIHEIENSSTKLIKCNEISTEKEKAYDFGNLIYKKVVSFLHLA